MAPVSLKPLILREVFPIIGSGVQVVDLSPDIDNCDVTFCTRLIEHFSMGPMDSAPTFLLRLVVPLGRCAIVNMIVLRNVAADAVRPPWAGQS